MVKSDITLQAGGIKSYLFNVLFQAAIGATGCSEDHFFVVAIGILMMKRVMNFLENNISPLTVVGLMASKGKDPFYEKFGFTKRPSERRGHGMFRIWK